VDVGGKGFNVSRMLMALGAPSTALALAGGHNGRILQDGLEALGIGTDFVWVPGETRVNVSVVTAARDRYLKVNEPGPAIEPERQEALLRKIAALVRPGDWWALSGSLPPGVPPEFCARVVGAIREGGAHVILDTSGEALGCGCRSGPDVVKPNAEEAHALTGLPVGSLAEVAAAAHAVARLGPAQVVVSLGKEGSLFTGGAQAWVARGPVVREGNPIGAGDAMVGGLLWGLSQGLPLAGAMRWATACGAATAGQAGTTVGPRALVESLLPEVCVTPVPSSL
jgi:1-phosphofructokinase family hexose kinase